MGMADRSKGSDSEEFHIREAPPAWPEAIRHPLAYASVEPTPIPHVYIKSGPNLPAKSGYENRRSYASALRLIEFVLPLILRMN